MEIRHINSQSFQVGSPAISTAKKEEAAKLPSDSVSICSNKDQKPETIKLNILHMNDIHGEVEPMIDPKVSADSSVGGLAYASAVIDGEKEKNPEGTLILNAGDIAEGSMVAYLTKGKVVTEALNKMGFDAIALGNHDFAWGQGELRNIVSGLDAPILAANITKDGGNIEGVKPYVIKNVNGVNVAVIGLDTTEIERFVDKSKLEGLRFLGTVETIKRYLPEVKEKGADLVVVLSHLGFEEDKKLAQAVDGIDVIVGGHSHTELSQGHKEGNTIIVQAGSQGRFVGNLQLDVDPLSKKIVHHKAKLVPVVTKDLKPDTEILGILKPYLQQVEEIGATVLGVASEDLHYSHKEAGMLNQIHADSLLKESGAELALCSSRNLRGHVKKGNVTLKELHSAYPMTEEDIIVMKTTGRAILAEIEDRIADGGRGIAVPAGFKYEYDSSLPNGRRVTSITTPDGKPLDLDREYTMVTTSTMARKKTFKDAKDVKDLGSSQQAFFNYFKAGSPWKDTPDDRVRTAKK